MDLRYYHRPFFAVVSGMYQRFVKIGADRLFDSICLWLLPAGLFLLLSAMFLFSDRATLHKLYYVLFSIPALIALCARPRECKLLLCEPLVLMFILFAGVAIASLTWSSTDESASNLIKRPIHTLMLFVGMALLVRHRAEALQAVLLASALVAILATLPSLTSFALHYQIGDRLIGGGALDNPLLSSHLFGFFSIYWLVLCMTNKDLRVLALSGCALACMCLMILATGSRTPLVALTLAAGWLAVLRWDRRSVLLISALTAVSAAILFITPHLVLARGDSYRLELWRMTLELIAQRPLLGYGYDAPLALDPGLGFTLSEPHSFPLGTLYYVGLAGFLPWAGMLVYGLYSGWRNRSHPLFILASTLLIYGIAAGLTEGGGILSRPKEHWFLLWIPLALIAALNIARRSGRLPYLTMHMLSPEQARHLMSDAEIIEEDGLGPKVLRLSDGTFLKLFRRRLWFTSGGFSPYSQRFVRNSQQLTTLGLVAPKILGLYRLADGSSAVHYQPLPGQTLRHTMASTTSEQERQALILRFGGYLAHLHELGVYFRSLHLGNVLVDRDEFSLIDIADMRIMPSPLSLKLRQRNLRHMQRYPEDSNWLFNAYATKLLQGYAQQASLKAVEVLRKHTQLAT